MCCDPPPYTYMCVHSLKATTATREAAHNTATDSGNKGLFDSLLVDNDNDNKTRQDDQQ